MTLKLHNVVKKLRGKNIMCYYLNIFEDNLQGVIKIIFFFMKVLLQVLLQLSQILFCTLF